MQKTLTTRLGLWFAILFIALGVMLSPQLANAHDVLTESEPEVGATVETTPKEIRLRFSGVPLAGEGLSNLIRVTDQDGNQWQDAEVSVEGYELAVPLCEGLPQGEYNITYRVIYSDGHTGEERFGFTNADPNAPEAGTPENCGEVSAETSEESSNNEPQDTLDADETADENSSASFPGWLWIVGGVGVVVIAGVVFLLLRGSRTANDSADSTDD